jgi:hypothetical protein
MEIEVELKFNLFFAFVKFFFASKEASKEFNELKESPEKTLDG